VHGSDAIYDDNKAEEILMAGKDKELLAISSIIELLTPLDATERGRVIEYVLKRLDMSALSTRTAVHEMPTTVDFSTFAPTLVDIRTLTAEKQPRSANEMVALIAYYVSEVAPDSDRSSTINADIVRKYFKMAGFPMPRVLRNALTNASAAGYLENVSRGEYRLNPVGYNLVVHGLPRSGNAAATSVRKKSRRAQKTARK